MCTCRALTQNLPARPEATTASEKTRCMNVVTAAQNIAAQYIVYWISVNI